MAIGWIKVETTLPEKPEVIALAERLAITEDEVVGKLIRFWRWCDQQLVSCHAKNVTLSFVDRHIGRVGFAEALVDVGWLTVSESGIDIPNFERHLSQGSKTRVLATERKRLSRNCHDPVTQASQECHGPSVTKLRPDKIREEHAPAPALAHGPRTRAAREDLDQKSGRKKTRKKTPAARTVRTAVTVEAIAEEAERIFRACKYDGREGGNLWGVAALLESGIGDLTEAEVFSACQGAALNGRDKPAHFFACLAESLAKRGENLTELLRRVNILPQWPKTREGGVK